MLPTTSRSARSTWTVLALAVVGAVVALLLPPLRAPAVALASCASVVLVLAGTALHRPRGPAWPLVALMLALWATGSVLVQHRGHLDATSTALVWAGQAVAATVTALVGLGSRAGGRPGGRGEQPDTASRLDLVVTGTVLVLAAAQLLAVLLAGRGNVTGVVVATVDVAVLGVLLRFTLTRRDLPPASWLLLVGASLTIAYDLTSALHGRRLALPGEVAQVLGVLCVCVLATAAVHPSMASAFTARTFGRRRQPSGALLGMLPLVLVPAATWWVAQSAGVPGLPGWTFPVTGALVAGLCLLRAAAALRSSEHLAEHDPLTDLANRRGLARAFAERSETASQSLLLVDLDQFKQVNDTHGHDVGDALLLQVRDRLLRATGPTGLLARLGGDEFVVLTPSGQAPAVAAALLHGLEAPVVIDHLVLRVGASIGIADDPGTTGTEAARLADLLTHADVAMYSAKGSGGGRAVPFEPHMRTLVARRYSLGGEIRQLLAGRAAEVGALEVHYQPLVELATGRCVGAEALVRWRHPRRGLLSPAEFLDLVSDNDLDVALDAAVLEEVLDQLVLWREQRCSPLPVSVNLTPDSLREPDLAERIFAALARTRVPPGLLHLEITEHERLQEDGPATRTLRQLDDAGVHVHLDDYGTGWTSLDYLSRFPVRLLKLDRSVVSATTEQDAPLVAGVQAMADALELDVLAEGVETTGQRDRLLRLGVRYGQGYLFSRPLPAAEFARSYLTTPTDSAVPTDPAVSTG